MVSFRTLALSAPLLATALAAPAASVGPVDKPFYIRAMKTDSSGLDVDAWYLASYHTGAGMADPTFGPMKETSYFINGTNLQQNVGSNVIMGFDVSTADTNYARWEPTAITGGYGSGNFVDGGVDGILLTEEQFGGWIACEWFHGTNVPQLFVAVQGYSGNSGTGVPNLPSTCANIKLIIESAT